MKNKYYNKIELKLDNSSTKAIAKMMDKKRSNLQINTKSNVILSNSHNIKNQGAVSPSGNNSGGLVSVNSKKKINVSALIKSSSMSSIIKNGHNANANAINKTSQTLVSSPIANKFFYDFCSDIQPKQEKNIIRQSQLSRFNYLKLSNQNSFTDKNCNYSSNKPLPYFVEQQGVNHHPTHLNKQQLEISKGHNHSQRSVRIFDKTYAGSSTEKNSNSRK